MILPEDYALRIRSLRNRLDLSQTEFAKLFPVSYVTVSRWETASCEPTPMAWSRIKQMESDLETRNERADPPPGVHAFMDASIAHITAKDNEILSRWAEAEAEGAVFAAPYRTIAHGYGYFVNVLLDRAADRADNEAEAKEEGISDAFFALQAYARQHGCWWINLDRDAETIEGLPTHEW